MSNASKEKTMKRRDFLYVTAAAIVAGRAQAAQSQVERYRHARRVVDLPCGRIAYVERGKGAAALFLHGAPLNGFQWRGALDRLAPYRRCIAPDFMGLGYSQVPEDQSVAPAAQVAMLAALLDALGVDQADIVASDSGGAVAQLFLVRYPARVRSMLLTNCDTEPNSPPPPIQPVLDMARAGTLADDTATWLADGNRARATFGAAVYHDPALLTDDIIDYYVAPMVSTPLRRRQYHAFHNALAPNPLAGVEAALRRSAAPVRMVWGASDMIFPVADAEYLDRIFPHSRGIRRIPKGKLFFQEEFPDVITEEALQLWCTI
jgi:pimeloyl-ACP methyl ester carboxylesterase